MNINLRPIEMTERHDRYAHLWQLLNERTEDQNISHKHMPDWRQHVMFVDNHPYDAWYFIESIPLRNAVVGAIYLTRQREVGIGIFNTYKRMGYGYAALSMLQEMHPGYLLANVNPKNTKSIQFFTEKFGAKHIQNTYMIEERHHDDRG